jgi:hypothetical protein
MPIRATERLLTADELLTLPDDDLSHELVRGEHRVNPPPGPKHGLIGMRIGMLLAQHVMTHRLGVVFNGDTGFLLVNPKLGRVTVHAPASESRLLHEDDRLEGGDVVPGFSCTVRDILNWPM